MADLQTIIDLKREGWSVDDAGYQKELERRQKANRELAELGVRKTLRDNAAAGIREGLEAAASGNFGDLLKRKLREAAFDGLSKGIASSLGIHRKPRRRGRRRRLLVHSGPGRDGDLRRRQGTGRRPGPVPLLHGRREGTGILGPGRRGLDHADQGPEHGRHGPQAANQNVHFSYDITVSGNGDAELMGRMKQIADGTVREGLTQYDQTLNRTLVGRVQQSNKRSLR